MKYEIELREFKPSDNVEYTSWFSDPVIEKYLGPAWSDRDLERIFAEENGAVLSAYLSNQMVGVLSVVLPHQEYKSFGITGIAVLPKRQRIGLGTAILHALYRYYKTPAGQEWLAFIDPSNHASQSFLAGCGWEKGELDNELYHYTFKQRCA